MDKVVILTEDKTHASFLYRSTDLVEVNNLRRSLLTKVKTYAVDEVIIHNNTTNLPDEMICLRLGLMVLLSVNLTNLVQHYEFQAEDIVRLDTSYLCNLAPMEHFNLVTMTPGQSLDFTISLREGTGQEHAKWGAISNLAFRVYDDASQEAIKSDDGDNNPSSGYLFDVALIGNLPITTILAQFF